MVPFSQCTKNVQTLILQYLLKGSLLLAPTGALVVVMVYYIYIYPRPLFQIFTQSIDAIDVTIVTLSRLNSTNEIDVTRYLGDILGIF